MTIRLEFNRIAPGVEIGPHRHGVETVVYLAGGELVFEHGEAMARRAVVHAGDVLYEAPSELHRVRNEGSADALALLAAVADDGAARRLGEMLRRWHDDGEPVRRRGDAKIVERDGIRRRLLVQPGDFGSVTFTVTEVELDPGASDAWHVHPGAEHALVVFEGRGVDPGGRGRGDARAAQGDPDPARPAAPGEQRLAAAPALLRVCVARHGPDDRPRAGRGASAAAGRMTPRRASSSPTAGLSGSTVTAGVTAPPRGSAP